MATLGSSWANIASGSFTLNGATLTYYIDAKLNSQSITNNTSTVGTRARTVFSGYTMGGSGYSFTCTGCTSISGSGVYYYSTETVLTGSITVSHADDGTKTFSMSGKCTNTYLGMNISISGSIDLPTIARASKPTVSTGTLVMGNSLQIATNRASSSFTHTVTVTCGEKTETYTNVGTSVQFVAGSSDWMPYMSSWEQTATVRCTTYNGSTQIGSVQTCTFKLRVDTSVYHPTIDSVTATDTNSTTTALETAGTFIKGYSALSVAVSASMSSSDYNYELASGSVTYNGSTQSATLSGQSGSFTKSMGTVNGTPAVIKATDNRGYTVSQNQALTIIPYANISITSIALERVNAQGQASETGEYVKYDIKCKAFSGSFGQVTNEIEVYSISSAAGGSTYETRLEQTYTTTGNGSVTDVTISGITLGTYSASSQFDISFRLEDKLSEATTTKQRVHEGVPVFAWGQDHFDVYGAFHIHDREDVTKYMTLDYTGLIKVERFTSASTTCSAYSAGNVQVSVTVPTGYKFAGVLHTWSNGDVIHSHSNSTGLTNGKITIYYRNSTSNSLTLTFSANILFVRE